MRARILLVDDNAELLSLLARLIEAEGWTAVTAGRGRVALDAISADPPDVAVVDVLLPDMMGYDIAASLRKKRVPFVFMTGVFKGGRAATDAKTQHGAAGYFEKPFEARRLVEQLRALVPAPARPAPKAPPAPPEPDFDVEIAVEAEDAVDAIDLTGKVGISEGGVVTAVLHGERIRAAPVPAPRPPPLPTTPPAPTPDVRAAASGGAQTEGVLRDNLPELITAFHLAQQTGELTLQKGKVRKTIFFDKGKPCFAISNLVTDRFGPFLARIGKIDEAQLAECRATADRTGRRTGDILAEMGLLKETEKLYYVAQQVKAIVYSTFGWEEGTWRLHFEGRAAKESIQLDLQPAQLILRGVKKLYKPERLLRLLSPEDKLIPMGEPAFALYEVELERWEAELMPKVDGTRTLAELIHLAKRPEHVVYGFLHALVAMKILDRR